MDMDEAFKAAMNEDMVIGSRVHIKPVGDYRAHVSEEDCWCHPTSDIQEPRIFVHHSMDGREDYETGKRRYN